MVCYLEDFIADVRKALDSSSYNTALNSVAPVAAVDGIIRQKAEDAAEMVILAAPIRLLGQGTTPSPLPTPTTQDAADDEQEEEGESGTTTTTTTTPTHPFYYYFDQGKAVIPLESDFLRLIEFKLSNWNTSIFEALPADDPRYYLQGYAGIRGSLRNPIGFLMPHRGENGELEVYGTAYSIEATIDTYRYIARPEWVSCTNNNENTESIEIPKTIYNAVKYQAAGLTASAIGENELSQVLFSAVKSYLA